ncbi:MAG: RHS repeat protein [Candidatus Omnitrophica bacterium]|nr:RHS repeat protein [Candidatus Omnitrophota bacterium]
MSYSPTIQTRQALHYQFDDNGNITTLTDQIHTATQNFSYDSLDRLTKAVSAGYGTQVFKYDPTGNLVSKAGVKMNYGENGAGPHAVTSVAGAGSPSPSAGLPGPLSGGDYTGRETPPLQMSMQYDSAGNMVKRGEANLYYDQNHRLKKVVQADNKLRTVPYDLKPGFNLVSFPVLPVDSLGFSEEGVPVTGEVKERDILEVQSFALHSKHRVMAVLDMAANQPSLFRS